jgi:hypothetical protein
MKAGEATPVAGGACSGGGKPLLERLCDTYDLLAEVFRLLMLRIPDTKNHHKWLWCFQRLGVKRPLPTFWRT